MSTIIRYGRYALLALLGWLAILVAMPFLGPAGREVAVVGDADRAVRIVAAAGGQVVEVRRGAVLARARPAALYRAGAWLVIEGRLAAGCFQPVGPRSGA
ncbi:MAG TPA: hypothetical protein VK614_11220 [Allosphingosinicella sp.]|nr:hypothetical protein [Allosphingosinicella sp.]